MAKNRIFLNTLSSGSGSDCTRSCSRSGGKILLRLFRSYSGGDFFIGTCVEGTLRTVGVVVFIMCCPYACGVHQRARIT